jgi:putative flavoprotein involved in K+ transport
MPNQPYCLIVGAGHSGLTVGARLKQLGLPMLIIEKNARPGDTWRNRYDGLHVHTPVWYDHMPYLPFPQTWPVFALDVWTATECHGAVFDDVRDEWRVEITRNTRTQILRPKHLVVASGFWGVPHVPDVPGMGTFEGDQVHASAYHDSRAYSDRRCVVIGSGTSAHDICAELWKAGADVTMVQRSPTIVMRRDSLLEALANAYSDAAIARGMTTEKADLLFAATPHRLLEAMQIEAVERIRENDASFYDGLARAGFRFHFGPDGTGILAQIFRQAVGYYPGCRCLRADHGRQHQAEKRCRTQRGQATKRRAE